MFKEFKAFITRGNVIDMAIGIIIGAAFGKIVDSIVKDLLMPPLGLLLNGVDFSNIFVVIKNGAEAAGPYVSLEAAKNAGAITINIGLFLNTLISFLIIAISVFLLMKSINKLQTISAKEAITEKEVTTKTCPYCRSTINIEAIKCPNCTSDLKA